MGTVGDAGVNVATPALAEKPKGDPRRGRPGVEDSSQNFGSVEVNTATGKGEERGERDDGCGDPRRSGGSAGQASPMDEGTRRRPVDGARPSRRCRNVVVWPAQVRVMLAEGIKVTPVAFLGSSGVQGVDDQVRDDGPAREHCCPLTRRSGVRP